ncbi:MAG TPA: hypothetical protein VED59_08000, partial [Acidimicrobiales bacterium]|nr:hypothetical protein [Acidimicrobiales bacterium]
MAHLLLPCCHSSRARVPRGLAAKSAAAIFAAAALPTTFLASAAATASAQGSQGAPLSFSFMGANGNLAFDGSTVDLGADPLGMQEEALVVVTNTSGNALTFVSPGPQGTEYARPSSYADEFAISESECLYDSPLLPGAKCIVSLAWIAPAVGTQSGTFKVAYSVSSYRTSTTTTANPPGVLPTTGPSSATTTTAQSGSTTATTTREATFTVRAEGAEGYYIVGKDDQISAYGDVEALIGRTTAEPLIDPIVGAVVDPGGTGLESVASNGEVFPLDGAPY